MAKKTLAVSLIVVGFLSIISCSKTSNDNPRSTKSTTEITTKTTSTTTATEVDYIPSIEDFKINIIETDRSCFGSAGCNISYQIQIDYFGEKLNSNQSFTIVYELTGTEAKEIKSFKVQGDTVLYEEEFVSTPPNPTLIATPTDILEN